MPRTLMDFSCKSFSDNFSVFTIDKNRWTFFEIILDKHFPLLFFVWTNGSLLETEFSLMRLEVDFQVGTLFYWLIKFKLSMVKTNQTLSTFHCKPFPTFSRSGKSSRLCNSKFKQQLGKCEKNCRKSNDFRHLPIFLMNHPELVHA